MIKKLCQNSASNSAILLLKLGIAFVLTPCIVHALGNHDYGIYEIVFSVVGYMGILEIGMQPAVTRFVASHAVNNDERELQRVFSSAVVFSAAVGTLLALVLLGWALIGARGLAPRGGDSSRYAIFLVIVACQVLVSFPGNVITSVHQGHQRYWLTNSMTAVNTVIGATIIYILLQKGYGLLTLTAANAIGITIKFCNFYLLLRFKRYGGYRFSFRDVSRDTMRNLVTFGFKSFVLGIATRVRNSTDSIVIGAVIGPAAVAFYMIPANLVNQLRNFISAATLGFMPFFSELHTQNTPEKMRKAYYASSRFMVGFVVCGFIGIVFLGPNFLDVWMGPEYGREGKLILYFLAGAFVWQMLNPFHGRILTGISKHGPLAKIRMIEAAANLGLSITLAILWGKEGVALGTLIPALVVEPLILAMVCRQIDGRIADYCVQALSPSIISGVASAAFYFIAVSRFNPTGYAGIALTAILGSLVFLAVFSLTISSEERRYIFTAIKIRAGFPQQVKAR